MKPITTSHTTTLHSPIIPIIVMLLSALIGGGFVAVTYYQDAVYDTDRTKYEHEKAVFDAQQDSLVSVMRDSLYASWLETHDTTVRRVEHIQSKSRRVITMHYIDSLGAEIGQHLHYVSCPGFDTAYCNKLRKANRDELDRLMMQREEFCSKLQEKVVKTGRFECSTSKNGKIACVEKTYRVWLPKNTTIHWVDTIWSSGYVSRDQWLALANKYADSRAAKVRMEYIPYSGHDFHYILKSGSVLYGVWFFIAIMAPSSFLVGLGMLILCSCQAHKVRKN